MKKEKDVIRLKIYKNDWLKKRRLKKLLADGYEIEGAQSAGGEFGLFKTGALGCLFLPLALLGRKPKYQEYYLKKKS